MDEREEKVVVKAEEATSSFQHAYFGPCTACLLPCISSSSRTPWRWSGEQVSRASHRIDRYHHHRSQLSPYTTPFAARCIPGPAVANTSPAALSTSRDRLISSARGGGDYRVQCGYSWAFAGSVSYRPLAIRAAPTTQRTSAWLALRTQLVAAVDAASIAPPRRGLAVRHHYRHCHEHIPHLSPRIPIHPFPAVAPVPLFSRRITALSPTSHLTLYTINCARRRPHSARDTLLTANAA